MHWSIGWFPPCRSCGRRQPRKIPRFSPCFAVRSMTRRPHRQLHPRSRRASCHAITRHSKTFPPAPRFGLLLVLARRARHVLSRHVAADRFEILRGTDERQPTAATPSGARLLTDHVLLLLRRFGLQLRVGLAVDVLHSPPPIYFQKTSYSTHDHINHGLGKGGDGNGPSPKSSAGKGVPQELTMAVIAYLLNLSTPEKR